MLEQPDPFTYSNASLEWDCFHCGISNKDEAFFYCTFEPHDAHKRTGVMETLDGESIYTGVCRNRIVPLITECCALCGEPRREVETEDTMAYDSRGDR